jgi:small redox-active disulfide protein 2
MRIQVLGTQCDKCDSLFENAKKAVMDLTAEVSIEATVERIADIRQIMAFDVLMLPALVIDGHIATVGSVSSVAEIKEMIFATEKTRRK